jgi:hypothetical protein
MSLKAETRDINNRDHPEGLAPPDPLATGHGCRSWWLKRPNHNLWPSHFH